MLIFMRVLTIAVGESYRLDERLWVNLEINRVLQYTLLFQFCNNFHTRDFFVKNVASSLDFVSLREKEQYPAITYPQTNARSFILSVTDASTLACVTIQSTTQCDNVSNSGFQF